MFVSLCRFVGFGREHFGARIFSQVRKHLFGAQFWRPISGPNLKPCKEKREGGAKAEP